MIITYTQFLKQTHTANLLQIFNTIYTINMYKLCEIIVAVYN